MTKLGFPGTFSHLESYLGLINWLRNYVPYYAQLVEPLKTLMLRGSPIKGRSRRNFSRGSRIDLPSEKEKLSYQAIQHASSKPTLLIHHDPSCQLYADVDASHVQGFGASVYHVKDD